MRTLIATSCFSREMILRCNHLLITTQLSGHRKSFWGWLTGNLKHISQDLELKRRFLCVFGKSWAKVCPVYVNTSTYRMKKKHLISARGWVHLKQRIMMKCGSFFSCHRMRKSQHQKQSVLQTKCAERVTFKAARIWLFFFQPRWTARNGGFGYVLGHI